MAWIELHQSLPTHRKTLAAADALDMAPVHFVGHLIAFWLWALDNVPDGELNGVSPRIIAHAAQWTGDPETFINALIDAGFIERTEDGQLTIHDWNGGRWSRKQRNETRREWEAMARLVRPYILERDNYTCQECGVTEGPLEIDHIIPIANGGTNKLDNLQVLCLPCNRRKGAN
jgi:hypothetical protein